MQLQAHSHPSYGRTTGGHAGMAGEVSRSHAKPSCSGRRSRRTEQETKVSSTQRTCLPSRFRITIAFVRIADPSLKPISPLSHRSAAARLHAASQSPTPSPCACGPFAYAMHKSPPTARPPTPLVSTRLPTPLVSPALVPCSPPPTPVVSFRSPVARSVSLVADAPTPAP